MANYKKITDVAALAETSETTNVLVEENGSLMKVPANAIGGSGNGNFLIIRYKDEAVSETSLESDPSNTYIANMTFTEFDELLQAGELAGAFLYVYIPGGGFYYAYCMEISVRDYPNHYSLSFNTLQQSNYIHLKFYSDNVIEESIIDEPV